MEFSFTDLKQGQVDEADEDDFKDLRKQLFSCDDAFGAPSSVIIYLRVRPKSKIEIDNLDPDCLHQTSDHELIAVPPKSSNTFKNVRSDTINRHKFIFSRIFPPSTSQKDLFSETLKPRLKDFFEGQNCLVFTYGVTNSGKSYTITGTPSEPGLLPRALDVIFNSIDLKQLDEVRVVPQRFAELRFVSEQELVEKQAWKENILSMARDLKVCPQSNNVSKDVHSEDSLDITSIDVTSSSSLLSNLSKMSSNLSQLNDTHITDLNFTDFIQVHDEDSSLDFVSMDDCQSIIYVSFAEIYNELIYDLLEQDPGKGKRRVPLKIAQDKNKNYYIKGLQEVPVCSVEEAMLVLQLGLRHRHVASTRLNYNSSRSHSIYSIKLVKLASGTHEPANAIISRISIVDLAGAERSGKTGAFGLRMKEAGSINNSLLVLGKCINAMKSNQTKRCVEDKLAPPFRESKLTCLFQNYLIGKGPKGIRQGKVTMFVNVSNNASVFDETFHVLKFSALTGKVIPITKCTARAHPSGVVIRENAALASHNTTSATSTTSLHTTLSCHNCQALYEELHACRRAHQQAMAQLRVEKVELEWTIRKEICQEFTEKLTDIEDEHCRDLEEQEEDYKDIMESRLKIQKSIYSTDATMDKTILDEAVLDKTVLDEVVLDKAVLDKAVLDKAVLDKAVLDKAVLDETVLDKAVLDKAVLDKVVLDKTVLDNTVPSTLLRLALKPIGNSVRSSLGKGDYGCPKSRKRRRQENQGPVQSHYKLRKRNVSPALLASESAVPTNGPSRSSFEDNFTPTSVKRWTARRIAPQKIIGSIFAVIESPMKRGPTGRGCVKLGGKLRETKKI